MDFDQTCLDFLEHFDQSKTVDDAGSMWTADAWVAGVERSEPPAPLEDHFAPPQPPQTRGVLWVLQWAAAFAVLVVATSTLTQFVYLVAAEHTLNDAARAGATEATLPRATYQSVTAVVEQHLAGYPQLNGTLQLSLLQNGSPIGRQLRAGDGDRFSITLSAPPSAVVPGWLRKLSFWRGETPIIVHAERQTPGRQLRPTQT